MYMLLTILYCTYLVSYSYQINFPGWGWGWGGGGGAGLIGIKELKELFKYHVSKFGPPHWVLM